MSSQNTDQQDDILDEGRDMGSNIYYFKKQRKQSQDKTKNEE